MAPLTLDQKINIIKVFPRYKGDTILQDYMGKFNTMVKMLGLDEDQALEVLAGCLDGKAAENWKKIPKVEAGKTRSWQNWIDLFAQYMATTNSTTASREALNGRKRKPSESLEKYMEDIRLLVGRAYPARDGYTTSQQTKEQIMYFVRGLNGALKGTLLRKDFKTPEEALEAAYLEEQIVDQLSREAMVDLAVNMTQVTTNDLDDQINEVNYVQQQQPQRPQSTPSWIPTNNIS
uniref:Gag protein n=1 Tax=Panagrolaimus superbus TaxID=310955 RepID=A0A914YRE6_9BILA